jgi:hypothetical protein
MHFHELRNVTHWGYGYFLKKVGPYLARLLYIHRFIVIEMGFDSREGLAPLDRLWGPTQPPIQRVQGTFSLAVKRPERGAILLLPQYVFMAWCLDEKNFDEIGANKLNSFTDSGMSTSCDSCCLVKVTGELFLCPGWQQSEWVAGMKTYTHLHALCGIRTQCLMSWGMSPRSAYEWVGIDEAIMWPNCLMYLIRTSAVVQSEDSSPSSQKLALVPGPELFNSVGLLNLLAVQLRSSYTHDPIGTFMSIPCSIQKQGYFSPCSDWLRAGRTDDRGSVPGRGWEFSSSTPCPDRLWGPPSLLSNGYHGLLPWG